jgi:hypothetical protein
MKRSNSRKGNAGFAVMEKVEALGAEESQRQLDVNVV